MYSSEFYSLTLFDNLPYFFTNNILDKCMAVPGILSTRRQAQQGNLLGILGIIFNVRKSIPATSLPRFIKPPHDPTFLLIHMVDALVTKLSVSTVGL